MPNLTAKLLQDFYKTTPMREGVLNWYPFAYGSSVLERSNDALTPFFRLRSAEVVSFGDEYKGSEKFDYVVSIDPGEITVDLLTKYYGYLKPHGRLLLAFENPYGLQYFAGKRNPRTYMPFTFWNGESKKEVEIRLKRAGFTAQKWYYPFTNHYFTREVYSQDYLPNEFLNFRGHIFIEDDDTKEFDERGLWKEIIRNGVFEFMCCSYLVEARVNAEDKPCDVDFATITAYREPEKAFITTVHSNGMAYKQAVFNQGKSKLQSIVDNHIELSRLGVNTLPLSLENDVLVMKRLDLPTLWDYWAEKLLSGELKKEELFSQFDRLRESIYKAAKNGRCYWELVPANCFYDENIDELIFFDQEYYWENGDPDIAVVRALHSLKYAPQFAPEFAQNGISTNWLNALIERYDLTEKWDVLALQAHNKTRDFVFNDTHTEPIENVIRHTDERLRKHNRFRPELKRYEEMRMAAEALKSMNIVHPVIYGYGIRGKMLYTVLETGGMDIAAIVDKQIPVVRGVMCLSSVDEITNNTTVGIIVVTPLQGANEIANELRNKVRCPIVTLEELVNG